MTRVGPERLSAAELIAIRARGRIARRLAWLSACEGDDRPESERAWAEAQMPSEETEAERRLAGEEGAAWTRLVELFGLSSGEAELVALALAVAAEPALGPMVAEAQQSPGLLLPTDALVKRIADLPPVPIWRPAGPLAVWGLVRPAATAPGEPCGYAADPRIVDWMFGIVSPDQALVLAIRPAEVGPIPPEWPVAETAARIGRLLEQGGEPRLVVEGRDGAGRCGFAAAVAQALERRALVVDPALLAGPDWADSFMRLQRFALYADAALIWKDGGADWPARIPLAPVQSVCVGEAGTPPARFGSIDVALALPEPGIASKAAIWRALAPQLAEADEKIATIPGLSLGDLEITSRSCPGSAEEAGARLRALARGRLRGGGRVVDPQFGWEDLMVSPELEAQLRRLAFEARARGAVLGDPAAARLFAGVSGLSALFSGPPGVGKSMAAQVIARELGVNLLIVDLSATVSKYVGETAKNLSEAFARARAAGAALIFEEADACFARRTDVGSSNDRHANADTGHLLQLMECHEGIVILSTNRRSNIDPAFIRRLRHVVEFPRPAIADRARLWRRMIEVFGADADADALEAQIDRLATRFDLSPAQIKSAALSARYAALAEDRRLGPADLESGAAREMVKEGRSAAPRGDAPTRRLRSIANG